MRRFANLPRSGGRLSVELRSVIGLGRFVAIEDLGQLDWIGGADPRKPNEPFTRVAACRAVASGAPLAPAVCCGHGQDRDHPHVPGRPHRGL
jgi:hypothetical protein